ncbi:MAG: hypothetical protein ACYCSF_11905 [Acidimicrobiales bacterium]
MRVPAVDVCQNVLAGQNVAVLVAGVGDHGVGQGFAVLAGELLSTGRASVGIGHCGLLV